MAWAPPPRPRWVERLNAHGAAVGGAAELVSLDADELIETARRATGLEDFGGDSWRPHYEVFLEALAREAQLHLAGRLMARTEILRTLRNRLRLAALWQRRPEILEEEIDPPAFVVGSPRSGTSILHELLALDTSSRAPLMWEMQHPVESLESDAFRAIGDAETTFWHDLQPEYETMHANSGELPNECIFMTLHEFLSDHWSGCHGVRATRGTSRRATSARPTATTGAFCRRCSRRTAGTAGCSRPRATCSSCARCSTSIPRRG